MKRKLGKFSSFAISKGNLIYLKYLKLIIILSPALFVLLLEMLRHAIFKETHPMLLGNLLEFLVVIIASFCFYRLVCGVINRLQEQNIRRNRELVILNEVAQTVNQSLELNVLLRRGMDKLIEMTAADASELFLVDESSKELIHTLSGGLPPETFNQAIRLKMRDGLVNQAARSEEPMVIQDLKNARGVQTNALADAGVRSLAMVPLRSRSDIVGVVGLFSLNADHFKSDEINLLTNIGSQIAGAIENARLYEKVQAVAVLEERERISKELHDGLAQVIGYVITKSQATRQLLRKIEVANDYLVELENVAQEVYTDTREAILGLRTASSGDRTLVSAVREYMSRFTQMHGIKTTLEVGDRIIPSLSPQVELQAIRIVQEALSNVRKHAEATRATVRMTSEDHVVKIIVEDDGKGFDLYKLGDSDVSKFGLRTIKERAESIRSQLGIESSAGSGTKVTLTIPLAVRPPAEQGKGNENTDS